MRYLILAVLILTGCATVDPLLTRLEKDQIVYNKYLALPLSLENLNAFKEELKQNFQEAIGPSVAYDKALDLTFESMRLGIILSVDDHILDRVMLLQIAKTPEMKNRIDKMDDKELARLVKSNPKLSKFKEDTLANIKQRIKKLDKQAKALGLIADQDMLIARLKYKNKRLQGQRAALALGALGQGLQEFGRAMQESEAQTAYQAQQSFHNNQMINKQNEILHELRMQNVPKIDLFGAANRFKAPRSLLRR